MNDLSGKILGNYQLLEEIGRGGMAVVFRAYQPSLNRYVAIKILPPHLTFDREFVARFQREAQAAARLRHPNIVVVHDVAEQDGLHYIVMELLEGQTLQALIEQQGALPPRRATQIAEQVAAALDYAHQQGFVHRDIKPSNIFVGAGDHITLTDFGIAKAASETEQLTRTGVLMGTPEYMAPEQVARGAVDHRTDLYALGVVLYEMLTGRVPFEGTTPHATLHAVIYDAPPPPRQINPSLPPAFEAVALRALAKRPEQRYQRGADLVVALHAALAGRAPRTPVPPPPAGVPTPRPQLPPTPARSSSPLKWIIAALAVILVVLCGALGLALTSVRNGAAPTATAENVAMATPTTAPTEPAPTPVPPDETETLPTDTAEIPSSTPTPTDALVPTTETATPTGTATPTQTETPTSTPTPTGTPTATATATASATATATFTPTPSCPVEAEGTFAALWLANEARLGCPLYPTPRAIQDAEQAFQNGHMFWRADTDYAYVVYETGALAGTYEGYTGMWDEGDPAYSCVATPPAGLVQPERGFGAVWCSLGAESAPIGWGLAPEAGFGPGNGDPLVQDFDRGFVFRDSDGTSQGLAYVFVEDGTFMRVTY